MEPGRCCRQWKKDETCGRRQFIDGVVSHVFTSIENRSSYNIDGEVVAIKCKPLSEYDIVGDSIVLKIDVEGQEYEVLMGAEPFFRDGRVKAVYVDGFSSGKVVAFLKKYGFVLKEGRNLADTDGKVFSLLALSRHFQG